VADKGLLESHYQGRLTIGSLSWELDQLAGGGPMVNVQQTVLGNAATATGTLPGRQTNNDVTFSIKVRASLGVELERLLFSLRGSECQVVRYASDGTFSPTGSPLSYTGGVLDRIDPVPFDNESTTVARVSGTITGARIQ